MGVWNWMKGIGRAFMGRTGAASSMSPWIPNATEAEIYGRYDGFDKRYDNSDYEDLAEALHDAGELPDNYTAVKSLRNPVNRVVEVYAANLLPDNLLNYLAPPMDVGAGGTANEASIKKLKPLIDRIWNWAEWKEEARRAYPQHGELWLKAVSSDDREPKKKRVYPQILDPRHIIDFDKNERGHLTYARIDVPRTRRNPDGENEEYLHVEVWDKAAGTYTQYEQVDVHPGDDLDRMGDPVVEMALREGNTNGSRYTGFDFIPIVHIPFRRVLGKKRGLAPYEHALPNIDRLNEIVTKLHAMLFPDVVWVLSRTGPEGEPLPPIRLEGLEASAALNEAEQQGLHVVEVEGEKIIRLPANASFDFKIPDINFDAHNQTVEEEMLEIERLLPELAYYRLRELELSGVAIEQSLKDLVDRIRAARNNFERGIVRFNQMAITIGQVLRIDGFSEVGSFEDEALEHTFEDRDVFTPSDKEKAEVNTIKAALWRAWADLGILEDMLIEQEGMDPKEAKRIASKVRPSNIPGLDLFGTSAPPGGGEEGEQQGDQDSQRTQGTVPPRRGGNREEINTE